MKRSIIVIGALGVTLFLGACSTGTSGTGSTPAPTTSAPMTTAASPTMTPSRSASASPTAAAAEKDIVDTAVAAGNFTTLATALQAAGLVDTLKGPGPFTVFAPTDDAFKKLPDGTVNELLKEPQGRLAEILKYHVVSGEVPASEVVKLNGQKVKTVQGAELTVEVDGSKVVLVDSAGNRINVTKTDVQASNGVIHVIDGVLMPPS